MLTNTRFEQSSSELVKKDSTYNSVDRLYMGKTGWRFII